MSSDQPPDEVIESTLEYEDEWAHAAAYDYCAKAFTELVWKLRPGSYISEVRYEDGKFVADVRKRTVNTIDKEL